jgi:hypothetical protein
MNDSTIVPVTIVNRQSAKNLHHSRQQKKFTIFTGNSRREIINLLYLLHYSKLAVKLPGLLPDPKTS